VKNEFRLFLGLAVFLFVTAAVYWAWTGATELGPEYIGVVALILTGLLVAMCGGYFWFVSRRIELRPEDRYDAEIADAAGEVGFFSPGSYWPFGIAVATAVAGFGLVFWMWWLIAVGIIGVLLASCALVFEYYTGTRRTAER